MATYDQLSQRVYRLLNDVAQATYEDVLVYDGIAAAHDAILTWVPRLAVATVTSGSDGVTLVLPSDLYAVQAVQRMENGEFLRKATMAAGTMRNSDAIQVVDWIEYPTGYISLGADVGEGEEFKLHYLALWDIPASEADLDFVITPPRYALQGMVYYAGAFCILPSGVSSAQLRQFNLRVDSGTPVDNPLKDMADQLLQRFYQEMKIMPPYTKVGI